MRIWETLVCDGWRVNYEFRLYFICSVETGMIFSNLKNHEVMYRQHNHTINSLYHKPSMKIANNVTIFLSIVISFFETFWRMIHTYFYPYYYFKNRACSHVVYQFLYSFICMFAASGLQAIIRYMHGFFMILKVTQRTKNKTTTESITVHLFVLYIVSDCNVWTL